MRIRYAMHRCTRRPTDTPTGTLSPSRGSAAEATFRAGSHRSSETAVRRRRNRNRQSIPRIRSGVENQVSPSVGQGSAARLRRRHRQIGIRRFRPAFTAVPAEGDAGERPVLPAVAEPRKRPGSRQPEARPSPQAPARRGCGISTIRQQSIRSPSLTATAGSALSPMQRIPGSR